MRYFKSNTFLRNWSLLTISNVICQILGMVATIRVARILDPLGYGFFGMVQVNAGIGMVLAGLGLQQVITRECARFPEKSKSLFFNSTLLMSLLSLPVGGLIFVYCVWLTNMMPLNYTGVALLLMYGMMGWQLLESIAFGHERMEFSAFINLAGSTLWIILVWSMPVQIITAFNVCLVFALIQFGKAACYYFSISYTGLLTGKKEDGVITFLLKNGMPFYWLAILTMATNQLPVLFLAENSGAVEVGYFSAGMKLVRPMQMMIMTLMLSVFPILSRSVVEDPLRHQAIIRRSLLALAFCTTALASFVTIFRYELVVLIFGQAFKPAALSIVLQVWFLTFISIFNLIGTSLASSDRQGWLAKLSTMYALIAVPMLWFGSQYGAAGLAGAMLCAAIINMTYHWATFRKIFVEKLSLVFGVKIFATIGVIGGLSYMVPMNLGISIRFVVFVVLFAAIVRQFYLDCIVPMKMNKTL